MPRYFFNIRGGRSWTDPRGLELNGIQEARMVAMNALSTTVIAAGRLFWDGPAWFLEVKDEDGNLLVTLELKGREHPRPTKG